MHQQIFDKLEEIKANRDKEDGQAAKEEEGGDSSSTPQTSPEKDENGDYDNASDYENSSDEEEKRQKLQLFVDVIVNDASKWEKLQETI